MGLAPGIGEIVPMGHLALGWLVTDGMNGSFYCHALQEVGWGRGLACGVHWTLLTSELITLASCGHTFTAHLLTSGKIKIVLCVSDPKFSSRGFPLHALASVLGLRHFVPWRTKSSEEQTDVESWD